MVNSRVGAGEGEPSRSQGMTPPPFLLLRSGGRAGEEDQWIWSSPMYRYRSQRLAHLTSDGSHFTSYVYTTYPRHLAPPQLTGPVASRRTRRPPLAPQRFPLGPLAAAASRAYCECTVRRVSCSPLTVRSQRRRVVPDGQGEELELGGVVRPTRGRGPRRVREGAQAGGARRGRRRRDQAPLYLCLTERGSTCMTCARDVPEMCPRCARDAPEMCPRCARGAGCARGGVLACGRLRVARPRGRRGRPRVVRDWGRVWDEWRWSSCTPRTRRSARRRTPRPCGT